MCYNWIITLSMGTHNTSRRINPLAYQHRITNTATIMEGEPVIRELHLPVSLVRDLMDAGMGDEDILGMYPELEPDDLAAVREWAAGQGTALPQGEG